jgi:Putative Flp pilus-assembly TadE/G-like
MSTSMLQTIQSNTVNVLDHVALQPAKKPLTTTGVKTGVGAKIWSRLRDDRSGSTMMIFGLTIFPVFFFVGMSVDMSRMLSTRAQSLAMIDAATLAGGRSFQTSTAYDAVAAPSGSPISCAANSGTLNENAQRAACNYLISTLSKNVVTTLVEFPETSSSAEFTVRATSWVKTPFLSAGNYFQNKAADAAAPIGCKASGWQCQKVVTSSTILVATGGGNDGNSIEISMMIDITGSMNESDGAGGTKIQTVKKAAADAVSILIWDDQSKYTSKVALVPFAADVRLSTAAFTAATGSSSGQKCVLERNGTDAFNDDAPSAGAYVTKHSNCDVAANATIMPLTADKTALKAQISSLTTAGSTAGHIGTAWAWYTLSPNFNALWSTANQAKPYGTAKLKKYAILMTDGDYNTAYWSNGSGGYNQTGENGASQDQAAELCKGMKAAGIEVYTIGAQVSNNAKTFLTACAGKNPNQGDSSYYYDATDGVKLQAAFRDIALKISSLRVNK